MHPGLATGKEVIRVSNIRDSSPGGERRGRRRKSSTKKPVDAITISGRMTITKAEALALLAVIGLVILAYAGVLPEANLGQLVRWLLRFLK
jgi:hypothetical protein